MIPGNAAYSLPADNGRRWLRLARGACYPAFAAALGLFIASIPGYIVLAPLGFDPNTRIEPGSPALLLLLNVLGGLFSVITVLLSFFLAFILFRRRPDDRMALFLSYYLLAFGILAVGPAEALQIYLNDAQILPSQIVVVLITLPLTTLLFSLFPDGRFAPGWTRWLVLSSPFVALLMITWAAVGYPMMFGYLFSMLYAQVYRYRYVSTREQKQQTKWFVYGFGLLIFMLVVISIPRTWSPDLPLHAPHPVWGAVAQILHSLTVAIIPVTLTISVMRYRLYDIDILINRTVVYGALTIATMGIYVIVVGYIGNLFQGGGRTFIAVLATGLVALLFQPLREWLQRRVNRVMYGKRDDPLAVLTQLGQQLDQAITPELALEGIVSTVARALKLPAVAIVTTTKGVREVSASYGKSANERLEFPLSHQGERIGSLEIARRGQNEEFAPQEMSLLENIAGQAGATVHAVRLMADLQRSRQQLVTAREEERRRLRRDLHDGLGASLAALHLQTGAIQRAIEQDPEHASAMVEELRAELHEAIVDIRRVAYELRPPALDELGLLAALRAQSERFSLHSRRADSGHEATIPAHIGLEIQIETPEELPQLPAAVEVAVYRIVQEALTNVVNHARAAHCRIRIAHGSDLLVEIIDDGVGIPKDQARGVGLTSMCERAMELGGNCLIEPVQDGGTRVAACFPILGPKG
jgi:signal transduction histidine kinase